MSDLKENNSPLSKMYSVFNTLKQKYKTEKSIIVSIDFRQGFIEGYEHQQSIISELEAALKQCQVDRDELQEERDRYEKALREIKNDGCDYFEIASAKQYVNRVSEVTDRALNIDDFNASWDE